MNTVLLRYRLRRDGHNVQTNGRPFRRLRTHPNEWTIDPNTICTTEFAASPLLAAPAEISNSTKVALDRRLWAFQPNSRRLPTAGAAKGTMLTGEKIDSAH